MRKLIRSILFAPANRPELLRKLPRAGADVSIACVEDGTPVNEKVASRARVTEIFSEHKANGWDGPAFLRINPRGTEWFEGDVECALAGPFDGIAIPKVGCADDVVAVQEILKRRGSDLVLILGIESGLGVINIESILSIAEKAIGVYFGAEDYATSIGAVRSESNIEVAYARARVALHARVRGLNAFDCSTIAFRDDDRFRRECAEARGYGYTGKICVHPRQVQLANELFMPSAAEVEQSRRLLKAYHESLSRGHATAAIDGMMIDGPLVKRAEAILAMVDT